MGKRNTPERRAKQNQHVNNRRLALKKQAAEFLGGKCEVCGYDRFIGALEFHHRDATTKEFNISFGTHSWEKIKAEA